MYKTLIYTCIFLILSSSSYAIALHDSLHVKGQISSWLDYNPELQMPLWIGARCIPQINYEVKLPKKKRKFDSEISIDLNSYTTIHPFDSANIDFNGNMHRLWLRYSTSQFELRAGLQKINFGSATIVRPLMWFDQIDPRDPLKFTTGVYGILGRYYFLNNANIWFWCLYGNENLKGFESFYSDNEIPEYGGRLQIPVKVGESALSYHHRSINDDPFYNPSFKDIQITEDRFGFDTKFDMIIGCWVEASWSHHNNIEGIFTNIVLINIGIDYTFGIGNGLTVISEQLIASYDEYAFEMANATTLSLFNLTYPLGLFDNLSAIIYYDWDTSNVYNFINWQRQFDKYSFNLMAFANPKKSNIPTFNMQENLYSGYGAQLMFIWNF